MSARDAGVNAGWRSSAAKRPTRDERSERSEREERNERNDEGVSYYGLPAVKPSPFEWETGAYLLVGGMGGAAQVIASVTDLVGGRRMQPVVRNGRYLALECSAIGALLLVADLKTPSRWYNMLRIFRRTSPMSIGSYVLTAFGATSAMTALGSAVPALRGVAQAAQLPAALAGAGMMTYTGALLSSTSNPLWAADAHTLAPRLACGALATGAAALSLAEHLGGRQANAARLDALAAIASAAHGVVARSAKREYARAGVGRPLRERPWRTMDAIAGALSVAVPIACYAASRVMRGRARALSVAGSLGKHAGAAHQRGY
jgi:hypothetical protein